VTVKIPLDTICVRSGVLCPNCRRKVESGLYEPFEVDLMRILLEMEDQGETWLKNSEYVKAYMFDGFLVILIRIRNAYGFSLNRFAREIGKRIGARFVKIIDYRGKDLRYLAQQLLSPAKVHGVNIVYMPDGSPFEGKGILPDIKIQPTIKDIKIGRDVILKKAIVVADLN